MTESRTLLLVIAVIVTLVVYDLLAVERGRWEATVSWTMLRLAQKYPIVAFALGVVFGHLFWPQRMEQ